MDKNKCPKMKSQFTFWKRFRDRLNTIWKLLKDGGLQNNIFRNYLKTGVSKIIYSETT
jgi:hypothetical protein